MSVALEKSVVTPEQLLAMPDGKDFELVDGELQERAMSTLSSCVAIRLIIRFGMYVEVEGLGWVFDSENGYQCFVDSPRTVRKPDVSFVRADRLGVEEIGDGWLRLVPDLVVEVISPNDLMYEVEEKIEKYRAAGVPLIWVVVPPTRSVRIIRGDGSSSTIREGDELSGEGVVPGFRCRVADLFPPRTTATAPAAPG